MHRYNRDEIFVHDDNEEIRLLNTFGFYWHFFTKVSEALRTINNEEGADTNEVNTLLTFRDNFPKIKAVQIQRHAGVQGSVEPNYSAGRGGR